MLYMNERRKVISILNDLLKFNMIDPGGGDISMKCDTDKFVITPTGSAFRRWHVTEEDLVVLNLKGDVVEKGQYLGPGETPIALALYNLFPNCQAYIHSHVKYSLAFASLGLSIPSTTNLMDTLGDVPCFIADDKSIKQDFNLHSESVEIPSGMVQRPDVANIFTNYIIPQIKNEMLKRELELDKHGLAFTIFRHGVFVFAKSLDEAFENLVRIESSAYNHILSSHIIV